VHPSCPFDESKVILGICTPLPDYSPVTILSFYYVIAQTCYNKPYTIV